MAILITVKYLSATSTKGARLKAIMANSRGGTTTAISPFDHGCNYGNPWRAAEKVINKWEKEVGTNHNGGEWVFDLIGEDYQYQDIVKAYYRHAEEVTA